MDRLPGYFNRKKYQNILILMIRPTVETPPVPGGGGALTLERGMGMGHSHDAEAGS